MSIISSEIAEDQVQIDGRRSVRELHTDHLGKQYPVSYRAASGTDVNAVMLARVPSLEASIIEAEEGKIIGEVEAGLNPMNIVVNYTTVQEAHRKLIKWIMMNKAHVAVKLIPLVQWLRVTYTAQQIATYLDLSLAAVQKINNRLLELESLQPLLDADDSYVGEVE